VFDVVGSTLEALKEKQARGESIRNKKWDGFHEVVETTARKLQKVARRSSLLASAPLRISRKGSPPPDLELTKSAVESIRTSSFSGRRGSLSGRSVPTKSLLEVVLPRRSSLANTITTPRLQSEGAMTA
jgi:hypothetical protein